MMWQDLVFLVGSGLSIVFLAPTLRDAAARVPLGTSLPSMAIGVVYGATFASLGMTFSAVGALAAGSMWALIAVFRSSGDGPTVVTSRERLSRVPNDVLRLVHDRLCRMQTRVTDAQVGAWIGEYDCHRSTGYDHADEYGHPNEYSQTAD